MAIFVVILDAEGADAAPKVKDRLREKFQSFYEYTPTCFMVSADALTKDVGQIAGLHSEDLLGEGTTGAVFRINGYSGYTDVALWEWIASTRGE